MIMKCECKNEYQDAKHGAGMRVHNEAAKGTKLVCTVCESTKTLSGGAAVGKKKK